MRRVPPHCRPLTIEIMEDALKSANIQSDEFDMPLRLKLMEVAQSFLPSDLGYTNPCNYL